MGSLSARMKPTPASSSSSPSPDKKLAAANASKSLVKPSSTPLPTMTNPWPHTVTPPPPYFTPDEALKYWIQWFRESGNPRPHVPYLPATDENLEIMSTLDLLLVSYLKTSNDIVDSHTIMFCGAIAACDLAGLMIPDLKPAPQSPRCDPWQISEDNQGKKLSRPLTEKLHICMREKGDYVYCSEPHQFIGIGTKLKYYMSRYYSLQVPCVLRILVTTADANPPKLRPIFDEKVRPGSLDLRNAGWHDDFADSPIWIEQGIFQNGFQSPLWFRPPLYLVAQFMKMSGDGQRFRREAEMILHLLPEDASYKLLALEHWNMKKNNLIVILKIIQYFTAAFEVKFIVDKCAVINVDIKRTETKSNLPLTTRTLRSFGLKETYRCFEMPIPKSLDDPELVDCRVTYQPEKDHSLMLCRLKEMHGKQMRAMREKRIKAFGPGGILEQYGPLKYTDVI